MLKIFKGGYLNHERERIQMDKLIGYLLTSLSSRENEQCDLIIDPSIPELTRGRELPRRPDAIIMKDGVFIIVELKEYKGKIIADCSEGSVWRNGSGEPIQPIRSMNPFDQAAFYRDVLMEFLLRRFVDPNYADRWARASEEKFREWVQEHVLSIVVTDEGSRPIITGFLTRAPSFFDVVPLEKLPQKLSYLRASTPLFNQSDLALFIESVGAEPTTAEWYRGKLTELSSFMGLIPKITNWMESDNLQALSKGLTYIKELELTQHVSHVIGCWHDKRYRSLRKECLFLLIEGQVSEIGKILDEGLNDEDREIFLLSLDYLSKHGRVEAIPTLRRLLKEGSLDIKNLALKAIAATSEKPGEMASIIFDFAMENLCNKPFEEFQHWDKRADTFHKQLLQNLRDPEFGKEFIDLDNKRVSYIHLFQTIIDSLGNLNCKDSIPWLMQIVEKPTSLGFETDDYNQLNSFLSSYESIFDSVCKAIGTLGIGNKEASELLIKKLPVSPEDYQQIIIRTLGNLGNLSAESTLMPYVLDSRHIFFEDALIALSKLKSSKAFGPIAKVFVRNVQNRSGERTYEALKRINPKALENILLDQLRSQRNTNETKKYLLSLLVPVASIRSADSLFPLLKDTELWGNAAWVLWKIADEKSVQQRALSLTHSENPIEKASAIQILGDYFKNNLKELEDLKINAPVEARGEILGIYFESKLYDEIKKFANDPDEHIRNLVFLSFTSDSRYRGCCLVVSDLEEVTRCEILITEDSIILKLPEKVQFCARKALKDSRLTTNGKGDFGVYAEIVQPSEPLQHMLIVPLDRYLGCPEKMAQQLLSEINPVSEENNSTRKMECDDLWEKIPEKLLPSKSDGEQVS